MITSFVDNNQNYLLYHSQEGKEEKEGTGTKQQILKEPEANDIYDQHLPIPTSSAYSYEDELGLGLIYEDYDYYNYTDSENLLENQNYNYDDLSETISGGPNKFEDYMYNAVTGEFYKKFSQLKSTDLTGQVDSDNLLNLTLPENEPIVSRARGSLERERMERERERERQSNENRLAPKSAVQEDILKSFSLKMKTTDEYIIPRDDSKDNAYYDPSLNYDDYDYENDIIYNADNAYKDENLDYSGRLSNEEDYELDRKLEEYNGSYETNYEDFYNEGGETNEHVGNEHVEVYNKEDIEKDKENNDYYQQNIDEYDNLPGDYEEYDDLPGDDEDYDVEEYDIYEELPQNEVTDQAKTIKENHLQEAFKHIKLFFRQATIGLFYPIDPIRQEGETCSECMDRITEEYKIKKRNEYLEKINNQNRTVRETRSKIRKKRIKNTTSPANCQMIIPLAYENPISYKIDIDNFNISKFHWTKNLATKGTFKREVRQVIIQAFSAWEEKTNLRFYEVSDSDIAEITLKFSEFILKDKQEDITENNQTTTKIITYMSDEIWRPGVEQVGKRAEAVMPEVGASIQSRYNYLGTRTSYLETIVSDIYFNANEYWTFSWNSDMMDGSVSDPNQKNMTNEKDIEKLRLLPYLIHELGHAIGLPHSNFKDSIMYKNDAKLNSYNYMTQTALSDYDSDLIRCFYGEKRPFFRRIRVQIFCGLISGLVFIIFVYKFLQTENVPENIRIVKNDKWISVKVRQVRSSIRRRLTTRNFTTTWSTSKTTMPNENIELQEQNLNRNNDIESQTAIDSRHDDQISLNEPGELKDEKEISPENLIKRDPKRGNRERGKHRNIERLDKIL